MKITRTSILTGKENTLEVEVTEYQIKEWQSGVVIQCAMPQLSAPMREFIMTGITPEEWNEHMKEEEDD